MADFTAPEVLYDELISTVKKYHPSTDISMIEKAYRIAYDAHKDQARKSGEPYIVHPLNVAIILADLELDKETIVAGILHDVVEDTDYFDVDVMVNGERIDVAYPYISEEYEITYSVKLNYEPYTIVTDNANITVNDKDIDSIAMEKVDTYNINVTIEGVNYHYSTEITKKEIK